MDLYAGAAVACVASFSSSGHEPPARAFAAVGSKIYRACLPTLFWEPVFEVPGGSVQVLLPEDPRFPCGGLWAAGKDSAGRAWIARSADCGDQWSLELPELPFTGSSCQLAVYPARAPRLYASVENAILVSCDGGSTWRTSLTAEPGVSFASLGVDPQNPDHLWAGASRAPTGTPYLWESFDGGHSWYGLLRAGASTVGGIVRLLADPSVEGRVYLATDRDGVWVYSNPYSRDAVVLTLRLQKTGILLDEKLAAEIEHVLGVARAADESLRTIHTLPDYVPNELIVACEPSAPWLEAWQRGQIRTGYPAIDTLAAQYGLVEIRSVGSEATQFLLVFGAPLRAPALATLYEAVPGVLRAAPNGIAGDGDRIFAFKKNGLWHFVFSRGWGDCPSGCIDRKYWYVVVEGDRARVEEIWQQQFRMPRVHRWNIPERFPATVFPDFTAVLEALESPEWWVRRHAVEVCGLLLEKDEPVLVEDGSNRSLYGRLRDEARARRTELLVQLQRRTGDEDPDVQAAAGRALNRLHGLPAESFQFLFPLRTGNRWSFRSDLEWAVGETVRVDGRNYLSLRRYSVFGPCLVRWEDTGQLYVRDGKREQLWLDFSAEVGGTWTVTSPDSQLLWDVELQSKDDTVSVPAGRFVGCYRFWYHFHGADFDWVEWYAPGVGPVKLRLLGFALIDHPLESARVCGIELPLPSGSSPSPPSPIRFQLLPPYPNPGRESLQLFCLAPPAEPLDVGIYDLRGRLIRKLQPRWTQAGRYLLVWDGWNEDGKRVPSGVYLVRARAGEAVAVRKITLVR
ncbi:MAG: T9SS type A sorting domain-containing protein [candidate division KSB1 bacterium]|nr:T9SS type A sorting domain-containing protein [candidate division KSB1 bacterium]